VAIDHQDALSNVLLTQPGEHLRQPRYDIGFAPVAMAEQDQARLDRLREGK
jgi:hypothetical protein